VFAWRGRRWGWTGLLSCACAASVLCLIGAISSPVLLAPLALCAVSAGLLLRPEVRAFVQAPSF
uniref:hypothetical protein n=1 Tax=Nocardioides sp. TaxID=35761 RepID=UPI0035631A05